MAEPVPIARRPTGGEGVRIVVTDLVTGDQEEQTVSPGDYVIVAVAPCRVDHIQHYGNGTAVLTVKGRTRG